MTQISYPTREPSPLSPRTAKYVAALMREGDDFDYDKWFQRSGEKRLRRKRSGQRLPRARLQLRK